MKQRLLVAFVCAFGALVALAGGAVNAGAAGGGSGSISLTMAGLPHAETFNTLGTSGTTNSTLPTGWYLDEAGTSARNNGQYAADNGGSATGDTYSYGALDSSERAFGSLQSGTLTPTIGAQFTNNTGDVISSVDIGYTGEQWRFGATGRAADRIDFQISADATNLTTGTWTDVDALDFTSPTNSGTIGALDGNDAANRAARGATVTVTVAPGGTFWIRWASFDAAPGADDGLAVDGFALVPRTSPGRSISVADATVTEGNAGPTTATFNVSLSSPAPSGGVTFDIATSNGSAQSGEDYVARSVTGATIPAGQTSYAFDVTVNGDTTFEADETFSVDVSNVTGANPGDTHAVGTITNDDDLPLSQIAQIQGAGHRSPFTGQLVRVEGVVIAEQGSNVWVQDVTPDADPATSEAILVFSSSVASAVTVGDSVYVRGTVTEFRPGCFGCGPTSSAFDNLTITELAAPGTSVTVLDSDAALPAATVIGAGGRVQPTEVIENDSSTGNVETDNDFDPGQDGIDFYESLEHMRVQVNNPVVVGPQTNAFEEVFVLADDGAGAGIRTARGGIVIRDVDPGVPNPSSASDYLNGDFNPERIQLDDLLVPGTTPSADVGDHFGTVVGILGYDFGTFELNPTAPLTLIDGGLEPETTAAPRANELSIATFNVENLDPGDTATIPVLARIVVDNLRSPDLIGIEEMQDNNGATNDTTTAANLSWQAFIDAIVAAGGPRYDYRQIDPEDDQDGGQPGGNIRVGFLFRTDRGLRFVDRPGGDATTPTEVFRADGKAHLTLSPGRVDPENEAWDDTRKPLAGEFVWNDKTLIVIVNHFSSKGGDDPLFGRWQPPIRSTEVARHKQAASVRAFVNSILAAEQKANVVVLGDINDFEFSETTRILVEGGVLTSLMETLPKPERYSYVFEGNSQVLDQILFSVNMMRGLSAYDVVHVNAEFFDQASDHDPSVARTKVLGAGGGTG